MWISTTALFLTTVVLILQHHGSLGSRIPRQSDPDDEDVKTNDGRVSLGNFESHAHGVTGEVIILDDKTIEIDGLNYDGQGPAAWFMLGSESRSSLPEFTELEGTVIPDENESCDTLGRYSGSDIKLKLPGKMKVTDYTYLSIYCLRFNHNFGYVTIPSDLKVKNGTAKAGLEKCPDDELAEAEEDSSSSGGNRRPARPRPAPRPQRPQQQQSGLDGLLEGVLDFLG